MPRVESHKPGLTYREIMMLSEEERYAHNVYHRWNHTANRRKLGRLYGCLAEQQDAEIMRAISGRKVLDVGAGYGFFARRLIDGGFETTAIDPNEELVKLAKEWYGVEVSRLDVHALPFAAGDFDTAIFREAVEHLDCEQAFREIDRLQIKQVVIFQTHLNPLVRLSRRLSGHQELRPEGLQYYQELLREFGFTQQRVTFRDVVALPLSGGTLTPQLVPPSHLVENLVLRVDGWLNRLAHVTRSERFWCWRFLLSAEKPPLRLVDLQ